MKNTRKFIGTVVGVETVGILSSILSASAITSWYPTLHKPDFSPPNWIFGPVWTLLYFCIGSAFYLVWNKGFKSKQSVSARSYFFIQLALNFIWTPVFFTLKSPMLALLIIILMWVFISITTIKFYSISKIAGYLMIPYLLWVSFATLLNSSIVNLN